MAFAQLGGHERRSTRTHGRALCVLVGESLLCLRTEPIEFRFFADHLRMAG